MPLSVNTSELLPLYPILDVMEHTGVRLDSVRTAELKPVQTFIDFLEEFDGFFPVADIDTPDRVFRLDAMPAPNSTVHLRLDNGYPSRLRGKYTRQRELVIRKKKPTVVTPLSSFGFVQFVVDCQYDTGATDLQKFKGMDMAYRVEGPQITNDGKNYGKSEGYLFVEESRELQTAYRLGINLLRGMSLEDFDN